MKRIVMILMAVALVALPTIAQQEQWQTSTMQASGSAYSSQVTPVGATSAPNEATTTASYAPGRLGAGMKTGSLPGKPTNDKDDEGNVPIGDPVWPLMLMALVGAGVVYYRRKKALNS